MCIRDSFHHPLSAASILADFQLDHESIMAAILHDVIEDTEIGKEKLKKNFGSKVAELVDGVSKLDKLSFSTTEEADAANLRKMILAMSQDIRVILIKLADRKHNLETINALDNVKRKKIGKETLEIFAPIALRLGIHSLNKELEDLAFQTVYPMRFLTLQKMIQKSRGNRKEVMEKIKELIEQKLKSEVDLIEKMSDHHLKSGGKRLRALLTLESAKLTGYKEDKRDINLAACVELIHSATLLHDDVIDESSLRRGVKTTNSIWGNQSSILVGDYLLSRCFEIMVQDGDLEVLQLLSSTSAKIAQGEVLQLQHKGEADLLEDTYICLLYTSPSPRDRG